MKLVIAALCVFSSALVAASPIDPGTKIIGGWDAHLGQFPHQVSLRVNGGHNCGGSILNPTTILTAAHCLYGNNIQEDSVVVGTDKSNAGGDTYKPIQYFVHEEYDESSVINDIGIVKLATAIKYNKNVQPVKLATSDPADGATMTISGWGYTVAVDPPGGSASIQLQFLVSKNLNLQSCANQLISFDTPITTGNVCTQSIVGQGLCYGDSGGPLINQNAEQVGIASWVIPCGLGYPDVLTSVIFYRDWIDMHS